MTTAIDKKMAADEASAWRADRDRAIWSDLLQSTQITRAQQRAVRGQTEAGGAQV
jgi:hypothetical protein